MQDVDEYYSIKYPKLYTPGHKNLLFNKKLFLWSVAEGIVSSLILFFIPYGAFGSSVNSQGLDTSDHQSLGVVVASTLVVAVNLRVGILLNTSKSRLSYCVLFVFHFLHS